MLQPRVKFDHADAMRGRVRNLARKRARTSETARLAFYILPLLRSLSPLSTIKGLTTAPCPSPPGCCKILACHAILEFSEEGRFVPCSIANVNVMRERARRRKREVSINSSAIHCVAAAGCKIERAKWRRQKFRGPSVHLLPSSESSGLVHP